MTSTGFRAALGGFVVSVALFLAGSGCADRDYRASVMKMNEGVEMVRSLQYSQAEAKLLEATTAWPENHQAWYNLGVVRAQQKKWDLAAESFANAVKYKEDNARYHLQLGEAHMKRTPQNISQAETHLVRATDLEQRQFRAQHFLGVIHDQKGEAKEAAERWTTAASISPTTFAKPFNSLAKLYIRWGYLDEAVQVLNAGIARATDGQDAADLHYHLGFALSGQNKHKEAIEAFNQSLAKRASNLDALRQRGFAYAAMGEKEKARADLTTFVKQGGGGNAFDVQTVNQKLFRLATE